MGISQSFSGKNSPSVLLTVQEILLDLVSRTYAKPMKWENAREAGMALWIRSADVLVLPKFNDAEIASRSRRWRHSLEINMLKPMSEIRLIARCST